MRHLPALVLIALSLGSLYAEEGLKPTEKGDNFAYYEKTTTTDIVRNPNDKDDKDNKMAQIVVAEFPSIPTSGYKSIRVVTRTTANFKDDDGTTINPSVSIQVGSISGRESALYATTQTNPDGELGSGGILEAPVAGTKTRVLVLNRTTLPGKITVTCSVYLVK